MTSKVRAMQRSFQSLAMTLRVSAPQPRLIFRASIKIYSINL
ncbi:hypothetical protein [Rickettsia endosymbiont of Polydrusus tereticollis]